MSSSFVYSTISINFKIKSYHLFLKNTTILNNIRQWYYHMDQNEVIFVASGLICHFAKRTKVILVETGKWLSIRRIIACSLHHPLTCTSPPVQFSIFLQSDNYHKRSEMPLWWFPSQLKGDGKNGTEEGGDRASKMFSRDCQLMGLTWLLARNKTAYIPTVSAVLRAIMYSAHPPHESKCSPDQENMPLAVDSLQFEKSSSSSSSTTISPFSSLPIFSFPILPLIMLLFMSCWVCGFFLPWPRICCRVTWSY